MNNKIYKSIVEEEVFPALWCTEPIAISYAVSKAKSYSNWEIEKIILTIDKDTYKNANWVIIPNSWNNKWISMAASLGLYWDESKEMQVLEWLTSLDIENAILLNSKWIIEEKVNDNDWMFISAEILSNESNSKVIIEWGHKNVVSILSNWVEVLENKNLDILEINKFNYQYQLMDRTLEELIDIAKSIDDEDIEYIKKGVEMQLDISDELKNNFIEEYSKLENSYNTSMYSDDLSNILLKCTSATYARMSWVDKPVMSSWGSWNQGIVAILLPYLYATTVLKLDKNDRRIYESIALSNIINAYVKCYTWAVSSMCWCAVAAWEWAVAAMLYQQSMDDKIWMWLDNMVANSGWLICDWAKIWCYNKVASSIMNSLNAVNQSINSLWVTETDWIIWKDSLESIRNLSDIANDKWTNDIVLSIIKWK